MIGDSILKAIGASALAASLAGCVHYADAPLPPRTRVLAPPDVTGLSADAQKIDRSWLRPQPIDLSQSLNLNAVAVIAVIENPDLKALRLRTGVSDAQAFAARLLPDPTVQASFDKLLSGPDVFNGHGGQLGFDLAQLRRARVVRESGEAIRRQVRLDLAWAEWQTAGQARLQAVRIVALVEQMPLAQTSAEQAARWLQASQRAATRGDVAVTDVETKRQVALDSADKLRAAARALATARGELNRLLGLTPDAALRLAPIQPPVAPPSAQSLTVQALERRMDLAALRSGYQVAERDVHRAVLDQFPGLSLTIATARDTAANYTLGPQIGLTLPLWNRNRGGIAVATATRTQLRAEYEARVVQTRADIAAAVRTLELAQRQRAALSTELPSARQFAATSIRAAQRGDLAPAIAQSAAQALRDRQMILLQLDQAASEAEIALELLTGEPREGWVK